MQLTDESGWTFDTHIEDECADIRDFSESEYWEDEDFIREHPEFWGA